MCACVREKDKLVWEFLIWVDKLIKLMLKTKSGNNNSNIIWNINITFAPNSYTYHHSKTLEFKKQLL